MADLHSSQPFTLPCGLTLPNRLVKAAMAEQMSAKTEYLPGARLQSAYEQWAKGGWGLMITGNVQVDTRYLGAPGDLAFNDAVEYDQLLDTWKAWAKTCNRHGTPTVVQINHPGRQSPPGVGKRGFFEKTLAPSPIPLSFGDSLISRLITTVVFGTPKEMTVDDIQFVIKRFVSTARLSAEAGFAGVEIHAAHGYLLAQFLSEKSNQRADEYGGSVAARAKIVIDIIRGIREATPKGFCVGLKLNSVDHQSPAELSACLEQLKLIAAAGIDFLEISGGTYENPTMFLGTGKPEINPNRSGRTAAREAFFLEFAQSIRKDLLNVPLMVTGGFRSRLGMENAIEDKSCDLVGLARPAVMQPAFSKDIVLNPQIDASEASIAVTRISAPWLTTLTGIKALGAGAENTWYARQIGKLGKL